VHKGGGASRVAGPVSGSGIGSRCRKPYQAILKHRGKHVSGEQCIAAILGKWRTLGQIYAEYRCRVRYYREPNTAVLRGYEGETRAETKVATIRYPGAKEGSWGRPMRVGGAG
jgi:hypothetical protein